MYHTKNDPDKHSSYMDGIPVKISELFKPPKKITLPLGIANRQPMENFEEYDFRLERSTSEKMAKLRELKKANSEKRRQRIAAEDKKFEELRKAAAETTSKQNADNCETSEDSTPTQETQENAESGASYVNTTCVTEHVMLTPVPVNQPNLTQVINNFDPIKSGPINISDFESDSSPFDNMELKTLNDIAELASVLQPNNDGLNRTGYPTYQPQQSTTDNHRLSQQQSTDNHRLSQQQSTDNHRLSHQAMYNQQGYGIKPSRPFIQQSVVQNNMLPSNGYNDGRINGMYSNTVYNTSSVSDSFWNHQPTVSYSSARTTPSSVYGASSTYRPVYPTETSDFTSEIRATSEYSSQNSDYRPKVGGETAGYSTPSNDYTQSSSQYNMMPSEYTNRIARNTSEYAPKFGCNYASSTTSKIGGTSDYSTRTSNYMLRARHTSDYSMPNIEATSSKVGGNVSKINTSEYLPKIGGTLEYAPTFPWTSYNYQSQNAPYDNAGNSGYVASAGQAEMDPVMQPTSDTSVESRLSGVADLIRELKLDLDDRRETDSRKVIENERIMATSIAVENDKVKSQQISKMVPAPQLPNPINQLTSSCRNLVHRIAEMGFAQERVARAVQRLGDNETKVLEFLLQIQRLEEESGCPGERVEQALIANRYDSVESARYLEVLQQLLDLGFVETKVTEALARHCNDRDKAIESLIS